MEEWIIVTFLKFESTLSEIKTYVHQKHEGSRIFCERLYIKMKYQICWKISNRDTAGLKKKILVPDIATIISHVVYQPNVTTPRGDILMSGSTKHKKVIHEHCSCPCF